MMEHLAILSYISQAAGLISILTLFWASLDISFHEASWGGQTSREKSHRRKKRVLKRIGIPCAIIAVGCQTAITLLEQM